MNDFNEEQQALKNLNKKLRFVPGDIVYWKTDFQNRTPMIVKRILGESIDEDYVCEWFNSQKCLERDFFFDIALKQ